MVKAFKFITLVAIFFSCSEKKEDPKPTEEPVTIQSVHGEWKVIRTKHRMIDQFDRENNPTIKSYPSGQFLLKFNEPNEFEEYFNSTLDNTGKYQLIDSSGVKKIRISGIGINWNVWVHSGNYFIDSLTTNRIVLQDTLYYTGYTYINTTTAIR